MAPKDVKEHKDHPECKAVYLLFGTPKENDPRPTAYVGLTDTPWERFADHLRKKKFDAVIVAVSTKGFSHDDIHWLEWHCIKQALGANRFHVTNKRRPDSQSVLNCKGRFEVFDTISILASVLGFPVFELLKESVVDNLPKDGTLEAVKELFYCRGDDADATGQLVKGGFQVRRDSVARLRIALHLSRRSGRCRRNCLTRGFSLPPRAGSCDSLGTTYSRNRVPQPASYWGISPAV